MTYKWQLPLGIGLIATCVFWSARRVPAEPVQERIVRLAELEIDAAHVEAYKAALKEEIETSIGVEPGVLTLYAVSIKGHPEQIRLFEVYRDADAYKMHLQSAHFKKYKDLTANMVRSLRLIETEPVLLGSKYH
jgi:quinol monooxygenase YgiN